MNKKVHNIGMLDVRNITHELADQIGLITNIGTYITDDKSEMILIDVEKNNIGSMIKTNDKLTAATVNGELHLDNNYFNSVEGQLLLTINGVVTVDKDLEPTQISNKVRSGSVNGVIIVPSTLSGVVKTNLIINGEIIEYDFDKTYVPNDITLNNEFCMTYFGETKVAVKTLVAVEPIDLNEFASVIEKIQVLNKLVISKENIKVLRPYLKIDQNNVELVDAPVHYIADKATLTESVLLQAKNKNLLVSGTLTINDIDLLRELGLYKIDASKIICSREHLVEVKGYCLKEDVKILCVEDVPFGNYSDMTINKEYVLKLQEKKVIANYSSLVFDKDIDELGEIDIPLEIKNYGTIVIPDGLKQSLYDLITDNYGIISSHSEKKNKNEDEDVLYENMGYLEL
jgi:hypothetical protein